MKLFFHFLPLAVIGQFLAFNVCSAQSDKTPGTLQAPPAKISIDGDIKDWGDSLRYYNPEKKINYAIANTKDTLYMAIRVNDRSEQLRILKAGITISIDPKGKKRETYSITFPLNTKSGSGSLADIDKNPAPGDVTQQDRDQLMRERLTSLRGIKVTGFKDVEEEMITTSNTYGFQAAVNYDDNNYLVCEAAIPMSFFHAEAFQKNEWAFNFKINGLQQKIHTKAGDEDEPNGGGHSGRGGNGGTGEGGMGGSNMGGSGMGGGGHRSGKGGGSSHGNGTGYDERHNVLLNSEDFWEKFYLAK
jgi:hypothetical protein